MKYKTTTAIGPAFKRVKHFHEAMQQTVGNVQAPAIVDIGLRLRLIAEEFDELLHGLDPANHRGETTLSTVVEEWLLHYRKPDVENMPVIADAIADILYVVLGSAVAWGIPIGEVFEEVCAANDAKIGGPIREDGKRLKPPGWKPPDVAGVLARIASGPCKHSMKENWDCGCSFGCEHCQYRFQCTTCGAYLR